MSDTEIKFEPGNTPEERAKLWARIADDYKAQCDRAKEELAESNELLHSYVQDNERGTDRIIDLEGARDHWIRLFNRLEAAVARHKERSGGFEPADDELYAAHAKVLKASAKDVMMPSRDRRHDQ